MPPPLLEIAVDDLDSALAAAAAGADRIELCAALELGGLTPGPGLLATACARLRVSVCAMVRPRAGDFVYTAAEREVLLAEIHAAKRSGAHGIVSGALSAEGCIDLGLTAQLVAAARPLPFTFHRAFDFVADRGAALEQLIELGVARVLTSCGANCVADALPELRALLAQAGSRIEVIAGGGVRRGNVRQVAATGVPALHSGARISVAAAAGPNLAAGGSADANRRGMTDAAEVAALRAALARA